MADHEEVVLLDFWPSPFAVRVKIALREKGVEFETREEDLGNGNKSNLLLEMNPVSKKIPVLIHNGKPYCESLVIVEYIDEAWTHQAPLLPSNPSARAHARFWANYIEQKVFPTMRMVGGASEAEQLEAAKKELIESFRVLEDELGDKIYFGGDTFGFVDIVMIPFYSWFYTVEMRGSLNLTDLFPKLVEWCKRCSLRESVSHSLPDQNKIYDFFLGRLKKIQAQQQ